MPTQSPYRILGVKRTATADEIKAAYRAKAKRLHPDHGGDEAKFKALGAAYAILSDPAKRRAYDSGRTPKAAQPRPAPQPRRPPVPHRPTVLHMTPESQMRLAHTVRAAGLSLLFDAVSTLVPEGELKKSMRQANARARTQLDEIFDSFMETKNEPQR